jgi:hypothetical protein
MLYESYYNIYKPARSYVLHWHAKSLLAKDLNCELWGGALYHRPRDALLALELETKIVG